ncbi:endonuclease III [Calderihabitans maritimus]|uniref:Endonuclease III n=1 Tax=Calderihabitans maritimus TaxID=1246530 RepID=A0A1Z5HQ53_9FIRM|nr:endonuclease III [Calderihabitans maritimus]GAW91568.1 DNA-(apurinic or apyrimidinic site) lyase [Calderihabitans maritimus]
MTEQERVQKILSVLEELYPEARTALNFSNPFELLVATVLSAQCTDRQVNRVTAKLFRKYKTPGDYANLSPEELETHIKSCGLYRNKARNIIALARMLEDKYGGQVPASLKELVKLPGVGRKTANVILSNAFGQPAMAVDTHVFRVARRLGLARGHTPLQVEKELQKKIPVHLWSGTHHRLIQLGRNICRARSPKCPSCPLSAWCPAGSTWQK